MTRLGLELAVVFIGVYGAFALSEYAERREAEARREQFQAALVTEIRDIIDNTGYVAQTVPEYLAQFDSAVAAGERPPLRPWIEPVRVQTHMWDAALRSGGLELMDVGTIYELSRFHNALNAGFAQLQQLRALSETVLIPNLGSGPEEFYDAETGALRPKYQWYRDGLGRLGRLAENITTMGDSLATALEDK